MIGGFFAFNVALSALNWVLYINHPNPWSLFAGIFCGAVALFHLVMAATE